MAIKTLTRRVVVYLSEEQYALLKEAAAQNGVSVSELVRRAVEQYSRSLRAADVQDVGPKAKAG